ncbi:MAG: protein kinase [Planctomycetes bacterium]|nr:protein kinase [Planctomycetota bacterium]
MAVAACPKPETLAAFARGDLVAAELSGVAEHVGGCEACCRALQILPEDSLAGLARAAAVVPPTVRSGMTPAGAEAKLPANQIPAGFVDHPRYRITGELGAGGMGTVYKAEDTWMARTIALKVVSPHLTARASALARFRKEVRAAAQLTHQNIVVAHDTGEAGGAQFLVMEFVEGVSLDRLVAKKGPLPVPMACMFARQAALGLQHAAGKGMVHRDIKPQNLLVTRKGQVKVLDFGLARFARTEDENEADAASPGKLPFGAGRAPSNAGVTNPNLLMGTPDYLSPEQAKNSHDVDPRSDVYSLGCTLYFLLTGKPPFAAAATLIDKLLAHTEEEPPPIRLERMEVTEGLAEVLAKMMAKKPADRYQTAAEVAAALLPFTRSDPAKEHPFEIVEAVAVAPPPQVVARPVAAPAPQFAFDTAPEPDGPTVAELVKPKKRKAKKRSWWSRRKWAVLGAAAALAVFVGGIVAARGGKKLADGPADPAAVASVGEKTGSPAPPAKGEKSDRSDTGDKGEKPNPWVAPLTVTPPKGGGPKVLYVLPSAGAWPPDYVPVRERLEAKGVAVVTASTDGGSARPHHDFPGPPIPIDKFFTANMDLAEYDAVIFAGYSSDEYMQQGRGAAAAAKVIQRMQSANKPVAAICLGQGVLVYHGVLKGKKAAHCEPLMWKHPVITKKDSGILWDQPGVTVDRSESNKVVVTASGGREAVQFADALVDVLKK